MKKLILMSCLALLQPYLIFSQDLLTQKDYWDKAKTKLKQVYTYSKQEIGSVGSITTKDPNSKVVKGYDPNSYSLSMKIKQGKYTSYHENGKIDRTGEYKNNAPIGVHKTFYDNGKPQGEITFIYLTEKKENGNITFSYNNQPYKRGSQIVDGTTNKIGEPLGVAKLYDENGILVQEVNFKLDKLPSIKVYENGKLSEEGEAWVIGTLGDEIELTINLKEYPYTFYKTYYDTGELKFEQRFDGNEDKATEYYKSGKIFRSLTRTKNIEYYESGNIKIESEGGVTKKYFENGQLNSIEKGKLLLKKYYETGSVEYENNVTGEGQSAKGNIKEYYDNGTLKKIIDYNIPLEKKINNGVLSKEYYFDGKLKSEGYLTIENIEKKNGEWKYYDANGILESTEIYYYGTLQKTIK